MDIKKRLAENRAIVLLMILGIGQVSAEVALGGFESFPDTESYFETVLWFKDGSGEEILLRIQRPLQILAVLVFEPVLGIEGAFILTNSMFYILSIPFFWLFSRKLLGDEHLATLSTAIFMTSFCVLYWGLALATDMLVWLSFSVGAWILIRLREQWRTREAYALALVAGIAILNKESAAVLGILSLCVYLQWHLKSRPGILRRFVDTIPPLAVMAVPFVIVQLWMLFYFGPGSTFFDYHMTHKTDDVRGSLLYLPVTFLIVFNILWLPYIPGVKAFFSRVRSLGRKEYLVWLAITLIPVAIFEQYSPRLSFLSFYLIVPLAGVGIYRIVERLREKNRRWLLWAFLVVYAVANNVAAIFGDELRDLLGIWPR